MLACAKQFEPFEIKGDFSRIPLVIQAISLGEQP
jgi:hypothetical protein